MASTDLSAETTRTWRTGVTARIGLLLGLCVAVCFGTGLISHLLQHPQAWFLTVWPTHPVWLYRLSQGLHVGTGIASISLIVVKLWLVWPKLFERPIIGGLVRQIERLSILVLVGSVIFEITTGLLNIAQWYAFPFFFTTTHYAVAWLAFGAVVVHVGVKLPVVREALGQPLRQPTPHVDAPESPLARRHVLAGAAIATAVAVVSTAGQSLSWLRDVSVLAPRSGRGPQGVPVNRSALAAGVTAATRSPDYRLTVVNGARMIAYGVADLTALPQATRALPMACVEGWSVDAVWSGVVLADLIAAVGGSSSAAARMISLEPPGPYSRTVIPARHAHDSDTLIALRLNGEVLDADHGYPCRLIAPNRPGVLQTKWLSRIEVVEP